MTGMKQLLLVFAVVALVGCGESAKEKAAKAKAAAAEAKAAADARAIEHAIRENVLNPQANSPRRIMRRCGGLS